MIYSKTPLNILLIGFLNEKGVYYFSSENQTFPGLHVKSSKRIPVTDIIIRKIEAQLNETIDRQKFSYWPQFHETLTVEGQEATLFLAKYEDPKLLTRLSWQTFPELIRNMPKSKNRLSYLKAWQILTGAWQEEIKVLEKKDLS